MVAPIPDYSSQVKTFLNHCMKTMFALFGVASSVIEDDGFVTVVRHVALAVQLNFD